jgi:undecaprenyl pyrophosphate phosphatase UppP
VSKGLLQRIAKMLSALTKKDRFSLFSSSFTNKTKTIIQLSPMFSIEWYYFLKIWFCLKWDFSRSQSSKRTTFLQLVVIFFFCFPFHKNLDLIVAFI